MKKTSEHGFSYIDVMVAIVILMVGILALLSAITASVVQSKTQQQQVTSKQIATSTMESMMSAKETDSGALGWRSIGNVGSNLDAGGVPRGIFLAGFQPVRTDSGADRIVGTADDTGTLIQSYQRQITITDICDVDRPSANCPTAGPFPVRIRSISVTVRYTVGSNQRQEQFNTILTDYAVTN